MRNATTAERAKIAELKAASKRLHDDWVNTRHAVFTTYKWGVRPGLYNARSVVPETWVETPYEIGTEQQYEDARYAMVRDVQKYESEIAAATEGEAVTYVPWIQANLNSGQNFLGTMTVAQNALNAAGAMVTAPRTVEVVAEMKAPGVTAEIPIETLEQASLKLPHGNIKDSGLPTEGYSIRSRRTGELLKYGETTRGAQRYSRKYLQSIDAEIVFEASGTKAEMHAWQHQKILEYKAAHGNQRPPLNKSDY